jgi:putative phage-type endonuclease
MMNEIEREEWLAKRRQYIGASEVAAILGQSPYAGPLNIYDAKVNGTRLKTTRQMERGHAMESVIAGWYADETGRTVKDIGATNFQIHPDIPFLGATLDRVTTHPILGAGPLEIKSIGGFKDSEYKEEWEVDPPLHFQIQLQTQMAVTEKTWGALCGGFAATDTIKHCDLDFNAEFWASAVPILEEFWHRVQTKNPPPVDGCPRALETVKRIWNAETEGRMVALTDDIGELVKKWKVEKELSGGHKKTADEIEARIRDAMKDAEYGALPDGQFLTLKTSKRGGYTVEPCEYRTLRLTKKLK